MEQLTNKQYFHELTKKEIDNLVKKKELLII